MLSTFANNYELVYIHERLLKSKTLVFVGIEVNEKYSISVHFLHTLYSVGPKRFE